MKIEYPMSDVISCCATTALASFFMKSQAVHTYNFSMPKSDTIEIGLVTDAVCFGAVPIGALLVSSEDAGSASMPVELQLRATRPWALALRACATSVDVMACVGVLRHSSLPQRH